MTEQASRQVADPNGVFIASGIVTLLGLIPGMPHFVFLPLGAAGIGLGFHLRRIAEEERAETATAQAVAEVEPAARELDWDDIDQVEVIALDIGYGLVPLANTQSGGQLLTRIRGIRKKLSAELGFLIQPIRIRDNLDLKPEVYQISLHGVVRGTGDVRVGKLLAINGSDVPAPIDGELTQEPAFGLDAIWIDTSQAELARGLGYTVVDAPTAIATHINAVIRDNASELLGQDETQQLLDKVAIRYPKLVSNLVPDLLPLSTVTQVLQNLLTEGVPVKDMRNIIDALTAHAKENQDPSHLTTLVRPKLGRLIVQPLVDDTGSLTVITLAPDLEKLLESSRGASDGEHITLDPTLANSMIESLKNEAEKIQDTGQVATLVVSPTLRSWMSRFVRVRVPDLSVLSYTEIPDDQRINVQSSIGGEAAIENETE